MDENRRYRFAFVSNSTEIATAVKAFADPDQEEIDARQANMEQALPVARGLIQEGVEVVLGGGATGRLLRQKLGRPVVTIARSHLDILQALIRARKIGDNLALTSFASPTEGIEVYESLLGVRIRQLVFSTTPELVQAIAEAIARGVDCIVGSGVCQDIATAHGGRAEVVLPGREAILRALEEARAIALAQREDREKAELLRVILQNITEGVLGVDGQGVITILNQTAARTLGLDPQKALGRHLPEVVRNTGLLHVLETGMPEVDQIRRVGRVDIVINSLPITVAGNTKAVVGTFKPAARIQSIDRKLKEKFYSKGFAAKYTLGHFKGESPEARRLKHRAVQYALTDAAVLIQGETGCGKEVLAQALHRLSPRRDKPFVAVNCSALPESLLESELFGYEEGAFTGAKRGGKPGLFELASEGSVFLDEIADIPPRLQMRLLRVLEEKEVMRVGGDRITPVDVRILSSTYRDLGVEVRSGRFRPDLYFRLAVLKLDVPPQRERPEDLPIIMDELLTRHGADPRAVSDRVAGHFREYAWPGNVRELDALIRRYVALLGPGRSGDELMLELLEEIKDAAHAHPDSDFSPDGDFLPVADGSLPLKEMVQEFERGVIRRTLRQSRFSRKDTARLLGISPNTLWRKLHE